MQSQQKAPSPLTPQPRVAANRYPLAHQVIGHHWRCPEPGGSTVFLLHGFASSTQLNWVNTGWINPLLDAGHSVLAFDLPGHGDSGAPEQLEHYNRHALIGYINQLLTTAGVSRAHFVGYSFGSRLAWQYCVEHPERALTLTLGGSSPKDRLALMNMAQLEAHLADGTPIEDPLTRSLVQLASRLPDRLPALVRLIQAAQRWPYDPETDVPQVPVLGVTGDQDDIAQDSPVMIELAKANGLDHDFVWVPGRDHINVTSSRVFKNAVLEFTARHDRR